jgi:putative transposase
MARAPRIERPGGRYHVTARGDERKDIFRDDTDRFHFLELLSELGERFGARVHAYVLINRSTPTACMCDAEPPTHLYPA